MNDYLTVDELSKKLRMAKGTIYNRLSAGKSLPDSVQIGRRRLFPVKEFELWMRERTESNDEIAFLGVKTGLPK